VFENLPIWTYQVEVDPSTLPANSFPSYDSDGITTTPHVSTHTLTGTTDTGWVLIEVENNTDQDFGYFIWIPSWKLLKTTTSTPMSAWDTLNYVFNLTLFFPQMRYGSILVQVLEWHK